MKQTTNFEGLDRSDAAASPYNDLLKQEALDAASSKNSFLANMSHEIRTPMNAIKGLSELLMMTRLDDAQKHYASNIVRSANSLLKIIDNILDFSRIDAGKIEIHDAPYSIADAVAEQAGIVSVAAKEKGLAFAVDIDPSLPSCLKGDDVRVKQAMNNILNNAVKYTNEGHIAFTVGGVREGATLRLDFTVADTGLGIRQEELGSLFHAFARADLHKNRSILGTGLGLALTKRLLQAMGGDIEVESVYGEGSVFRFWIRQEIVDETPVARVNDAASTAVLLFADGVPGDAASRMLERLGVRYTHCRTGDELLRALPGDFTHLLYFEEASMELVKRLAKNAGKIPDATALVAVRDIRYAMEQNYGERHVIFEPLMATNLADALNRTAATSSAIHQGTPEQTAGHARVEGVTALLVDDNDINLLVGEEILGSFGLEVESVSSGMEALSACAAHSYDIIFMDHMMPIMDGLETARRIRAQKGPNERTPIVALTANVAGDTKDTFMHQGLDDFIGKPIEIAELSRVLGTWLPPEKFGHAHRRHTPSTPPPGEAAPFDLVTTLDEFGMYASDVVKELRGDRDLYLSRLQTGMLVLPDLTDRVKKLLDAENLPEFAVEMEDLSRLLRDVGARDCAGRAKKISTAAAEGNTGYVHSDFKPLMGNMFMLGKKLQRLVPFVKGQLPDPTPMNDPTFIASRLEKMASALRAKDPCGTTDALEEIAGISLDKDLDADVNKIRAALEDSDYEGAQAIADRLVSERT
ncbi:response regulator [Synergistaceae bacterium OttesenSCG-928-I11]|nr:response regulator [Synergistaceae bacterium OttesenSCG-928-I11]